MGSIIYYCKGIAEYNRPIKPHRKKIHKRIILEIMKHSSLLFGIAQKTSLG